MVLGHTLEHTILVLVAVGIGGFMAGIGLVFGAFAIRQLRYYLRIKD